MDDFLLLQETTAPKDAGLEMPTAQPCVVVRDSLQEPKDAFLVIEEHVFCKVPLAEIPLAFLAAFFLF